MRYEPNIILDSPTKRGLTYIIIPWSNPVYGLTHSLSATFLLLAMIVVFV